MSYRTLSIVAVPLAVTLLCAAGAHAQRRVMQPGDLFRVERLGAITYAPDGRQATVEIRRPGRWLDGDIPTTDIGLIDVTTGALRILTPSSPAYIGFFGARWSPTGERLVLLSVDTNAVIRPWVWTMGASAPVLLPDFVLHESAADPAVAFWSDADHVVFRMREPSAPSDGPLYVAIQRARNVADAWQRARAARTASVTVLDAHGLDTVAAPSRIVSVHVRTGAVTTLARGAVHRPRLSADGRTLTWSREHPALPVAQASTFFDPRVQAGAIYDRVNWGHEVHHVDARTGASVPPPAPDTTGSRPPAAARAALRVADDPEDGTTLWLARPGRPDTVIWRGNAWVRDIEPGRAEAIRYTASDGTALTGWFLYPPGHATGRPLPIVTIVYPGALYTERVPRTFSLLNEHFEHPQMFAALGYGVLLPSMPEPEQPLQHRALDALPRGVLPLLDTLIARGIADSGRIALLGQSAGGYATLGLITQTDRFRTAIASAAYANLTSLYGTFYGQYRYGDGGHPQHAQVLRMLQFERGYFGAGAPPWEEPERYRLNSPITHVAHVRTPLMLIHGDADFIPVQQAEEVFTALYRRDQRVRFLRYAGEGHTISARENVLDLWQRIDDWLRETMPPP